MGGETKKKEEREREREKERGLCVSVHPPTYQYLSRMR